MFMLKSNLYRILVVVYLLNSKTTGFQIEGTYSLKRWTKERWKLSDNSIEEMNDTKNRFRKYWEDTRLQRTVSWISLISAPLGTILDNQHGLFGTLE